ncbi:MAG: hypothetical protein JXA35_02935, partial [Deltaproteobacteria bacterium]|nr:hypothetical protein [Deltaproteobacteria bacterium]
SIVDQAGKGWDGFLKFLTAKNSIMCSILKDFSLLRLTDEILEVETGKRSFASGYFQDKDRFEQLSAYCREFFKRDMRVIFSSGGEPGSRTGQSPDSKPDDGTKMGLKESDMSEAVQDVLDLFKGEIVQVYPADDAGNHNLEEEEKNGR